MPQQTYNIGYGSNDFFSNNNQDIAKTLPFNKEKLFDWAKNFDSTINKNQGIDIFDPKITAVVFAHESEFINNYL